MTGFAGNLSNRQTYSGGLNNEKFVGATMGKFLTMKKVVHYDKLLGCKVGFRASVWPVDHPAVPVGECATTTSVQSFDPLTGVVETANTRYVPSYAAAWPGMGDDEYLELTYDDVNDTLRLTVQEPFGQSDLVEQDTTQRATDFAEHV